MPRREVLEYNKRVDVGVILEQNWMLSHIPEIFSKGELFYCFSMDRDVYDFEKSGTKYAFLQAHGASIAACYVEEFVKRSARKVYRIGTCGSLQRDIEFGDIIISTGAIKDEGTSAQYVPEHFPAISPYESVISLSKKLSDAGLNVHTGITWTTDGRFVESNDKITKFSDLGVKNVDMETSALMTVCSVRKVDGLSIGIVTDRPIDDLQQNFKGKIRDLSENRKMLKERLYKITEIIVE